MKVLEKAVFAHYLVGEITPEHARQDVLDAHALGIDAFALNVGHPGAPYVNDALSYLFETAENVGLGLFISMDLAGAGYYNQTALDFADTIHQYQDSPAYLHGPNGYPFLSTFSDGGWTKQQWQDFTSVVMHNKSYFVPDFDGTQGYYDNAQGWWNYWGNVTDGFFSWESAWPLRAGYSGKYPGDTSVDEVVIKGMVEHNKSYMIGLSSLQYKDAYYTNIYRQGDLNLVKRMENILKMDPSPNYVQVITWNDGPEAHYIGNLFEEQYDDFWAEKYSGPDFPHTGWQPLVSSFAKAFKNGKKSSEDMAPANGEIASGSIWYHPMLTTTTCTNGTAGTPPPMEPPTEPNNCAAVPPQGYYEVKPDGFNNATDSINWAITLSPGAGQGYQVRTSSNGKVLETRKLRVGLNYGNVKGIEAGQQKIELIDGSGRMVMSAGDSAIPVASDCPTGTYNLNYVVDALAKPDSYGSHPRFPGYPAHGMRNNRGHGRQRDRSYGHEHDNNNGHMRGYTPSYGPPRVYSGSYYQKRRN